MKVVSMFELAQSFVGHNEIVGIEDDPLIMAMLRLDADWPEHDEVPWCSAFVNFICKMMKLPRSRSLRARSWLQVGHGVATSGGVVGSDIVVLSRGKGRQPGPEVIAAPGHVGFFAGHDGTKHVLVLGGNQGDQVSVARFPVKSILGVRRVA
jgi:uncharacterized protein (TIGR02594 family)